MDREYLKYVLNAGPSRVLDVRKISMDNNNEPLFKTSILNSAILLKQTPSDEFEEELPNIATNIFLPYDRNRPEDGGESFFFTPATLRATVCSRMGEKNVKADHLAADTELMQMFNRVPSFSPFLIKDMLERSNMNVPTGYFSIPEREAAVIKQRMRARLRPLVASAFAGDRKVMNARAENAIERLALKLWELDDMDELMPLIHAFRIPPAAAPKIFYCWLGIAFFENEYLTLQSRLQKFAHWIGTKSHPKEALPRELMALHKSSATLVKQQLQGQWKRSLQILQEYTTSYDELVGEKASAARFITFLSNSSSHFWTLGGCLSRLEQSVETWELICKRFNFESLTFERLTTLFEMLNQINSRGGGAAHGTHLAAPG